MKRAPAFLGDARRAVAIAEDAVKRAVEDLAGEVGIRATMARSQAETARAALAETAEALAKAEGFLQAASSGAWMRSPIPRGEPDE